MSEKGYTYTKEGILSIPARLLYEDWGLMSYDSYKYYCKTKELKRSREGKGLGNEALLSYHDLPQEIKDICVEKLGHYKDSVIKDDFSPMIKPDAMAAKFFAEYQNPEGKKLTTKQQIERATSCMILNVIKDIWENNPNARGTRSTTKIWNNLSNAVNLLNKERWSHILPTSAKNLKIRYQRYIKEGYASFIHANEGNKVRTKIQGEIADYLLSVFCLPVKYTVPEVLALYNEERQHHDWAEVSEQAVNKFLNKPENKRVWYLQRHGKEAYDRLYKHTIKRDKKRWFPNCYWGIDGTKLDLTYINPDTKKVEAYKRVNIIFDVYSEKIIGWSFSESETMTDHFRALKMAVQIAGVRPYLFTYDNQSGHKSQKMQDIYNAIVATDGGTHYPHRARGHASPIEGLIRRLQQQHVTKLWNSDGLGVKTKTDQSHANQDFLAENKHNLPTINEVLAQWEYIVKEWNNAKHYEKKHKTRNEVYNEEMLVREDLELYEIMRLMWVEEKKKPITYKANGITVIVDGVEHIYEVYDRDNQIDLDFRWKHVGDKFIVRYDPDAMDGHIQLMKANEFGEKYFVAYAEPKRESEVVPKLMRKGEKEQTQKDMSVRDTEVTRAQKAYEELIARTGISRERFIAEQEQRVKTQGRLHKGISIKADRGESLLHQL